MSVSSTKCRVSYERTDSQIIISPFLYYLRVVKTERPLLRKLLHISPLLLVLLCPSGLAYMFFAWQKHQVKETVKARLLAGMDPSELMELKLSKTDAEALLEWEDEREFEYQGQMYDVVKMNAEGDSIRFTCYRDQAESRLEQELRRLLAQPLKDDPAAAGNAQRLIDFYQSLFCVEGPSWAPAAWKKNKTAFFHASSSGLFSMPPAAPPPEV